MTTPYTSAEVAMDFHAAYRAERERRLECELAMRLSLWNLVRGHEYAAIRALKTVLDEA